ncbi:hypothetical protein BKA70DRAFT_1241082 [Coprinopsis sp. MPI-PUGE-AT-0042]|nr:hypothetical protein BKA70DRAFT_1241082 [Coprinopsis sp. MPI-PUGE-AT-0042]
MGSNSTSSTNGSKLGALHIPTVVPKGSWSHRTTHFGSPHPLEKSATPRSFGTRSFSTPEASGHRGNNVNTSPSKVKVEEMTPVGSLFSRPASPAGWRWHWVHFGRYTFSHLCDPSTFRSELETDPEGAVAEKSPLFSSPTGHGMSENGAGFDDVGEAQDNQSLNIFDGGWPAPGRPFGSKSSTVEVGVVRVDATLFSNLIFRSFDPVAIPPSNLSPSWPRVPLPCWRSTQQLSSACYGIASACDHFVFADNVRLHNCPEAEQLGEPLPEDFDIIEYLTGQGSHGLLQWQLVSVTAHCTLCDKLVFQDEGAVRHRCDCGRWQW